MEPVKRFPDPPPIPGRRLDESEDQEHKILHTLRSEIASLLKRASIYFPGAQPISFSRKHFQDLLQRDFYVCEKSDGIRCLLYLTKNEYDQEIAYLIDRKNDYYFLQGMHFPLPESQIAFHIDTIIDGELVNDIEPDGSIRTKYLVFDLLTTPKNPSLFSRSLDKRLGYLNDEILEPYRALYRQYPEEESHVPFLVQMKPMEFSYACNKMFTQVIPELSHGNDGLIFTCRETPYVFGTDSNILKWKSSEENTVDFKLSFDWPLLDPDEHDMHNEQYPDYSAQPICNLFADGRDQPFGNLNLSEKEWKKMISRNEALDARIVECYRDASGRWRFVRFRDDKRSANYITTVQSVMDSIQDGVSRDELLEYCEGIRTAYKSRATQKQSSARVGNSQREKDFGGSLRVVQQRFEEQRAAQIDDNTDATSNIARKRKLNDL